MTSSEVTRWNSELRNASPVDVGRWAVAQSGGCAIVSTNFRPSDLRDMNNSTTAWLRETRLRSVLKAVSWRCVGTLDTFLASLVVLTFTGVTTGDTFNALQISGGIASVEVLTKIMLYYFHERAWMRVRLGRAGE